MIFEKVKKFYLDYSGKKCIIGYSFRGLEIYAFHIGSQLGRQFISTYAIHGREWITAELALKHIKIGVKRGGGWIIPLVNPDGAKICETSNPLWKANARGVDLNCNFDASWGSGMFNTRVRGAENCIGEYPFSETESNALKNFTLKVRPEVTFSFHTKGGEIYWEFLGRGERYGATLLQKATGYPIKTLRGSAGGYKDWCIDKLHIPAYTIECGSENLTHPIKNIKKLKKCYKALKYFTENYGK